MTTAAIDIHRPPTTTARAETVHIVAWRLFDFAGEELTLGGLQRWLLGLIDVLGELGHDVIVHQKAKLAFRKRVRPHAIVQGHPVPLAAIATPLFNLAVHRTIPKDAPVVYMVEDVAFPVCRARSLLIQHGIWWDGEYGRIKHRAAETMARRAVSKTAGTICVDTNFINWYRARWPDSGHDERFHYVPNFIDPRQFGAQPAVPAAAGSSERLTICFPRRSEPRRGMRSLAAIAPRLLAEFDHVDLRFVVGSGHHTDALRNEIQTTCPEGRVRIEALPMDGMRAAYAESDIVTIPTLCGEGTSLAAIEAMYFGCAVVATWVGGLPNLIQDGHNGLLIRPGSEALYEALTQLIRDADLRRRLGTTAMHSVLPQFAATTWRSRLRTILPQHLGLTTGVAG